MDQCVRELGRGIVTFSNMGCAELLCSGVTIAHSVTDLRKCKRDEWLMNLQAARVLLKHMVFLTK